MQDIKDHLGLANDGEIKKLLEPGGTSDAHTSRVERLLFSGKVSKFNPTIGWKQTRNIIITNKSILNLKNKCSSSQPNYLNSTQAENRRGRS